MNRIIYPAVFHEEESGFFVRFPDFDYVFTQGESINEAYEMSIDALFLAITSAGKRLPKASSPAEIKLNENENIVLIDFDIEEYSRRMNLKTVKKTLSIPGWLNESAISAGINFSEVLKKALKQELGFL